MEQNATVVSMTPWGAGEIHDTVELSWPMSSGAQYEFFRDIAGKEEHHCNIRTPRRIRVYHKFMLEDVSVTWTRWAGDDVIEYLRQHGHLTLKVNERPILSVSLAELDTLRVFEGEDRIQITDNDEIRSSVQFQVSKAFSEPEIMEVKAEVVDETLVTIPFPRAASLFQAWGLPTEIKRRNQTHRWLTRKISGRCLMKLTLHGQIHTPVGR